MLLEILVGTKMILGLDSYNDYMHLLAAIGRYIDRSTHILLTWFLEKSVNCDPRDFTNEVMPTNPDLIKENIMRLEIAVHYDADLHGLWRKAE